MAKMKLSEKFLFTVLMIVLVTSAIAKMIRGKLAGGKLDGDLPWIGASVTNNPRPAE